MRRLLFKQSNSQLLLTFELIFLIIFSSCFHLMNARRHVRYLHNLHHDRHRHLNSRHKNSLNYLINPANSDSLAHHHLKLGLKNKNLLHKNKFNSIDDLKSTSEPMVVISEKPPLTFNLTSSPDYLVPIIENGYPSNFQLNNNDNKTHLVQIQSSSSKHSKRYAYASIMLNDDEKTKTQCKVTPTTQNRLCANCDQIVKDKKLIRIAVLAPTADHLPYSLNKILPSILHAVNMIEQGESIQNQNRNQSDNLTNRTATNRTNDFEHLTASYQFVIYYRDTNCSSSIGPLAAFDFFIEGSFDVFFGPLCDYVLAPVTRYASIWNKPVLTSGGQNDNFDIKGVYYRLLTRMNGSYSQMGSLLVQVSSLLLISLLVINLANLDF